MWQPKPLVFMACSTNPFVIQVIEPQIPVIRRPVQSEVRFVTSGRGDTRDHQHWQQCVGRVAAPALANGLFAPAPKGATGHVVRYGFCPRFDRVWQWQGNERVKQLLNTMWHRYQPVVYKVVCLRHTAAGCMAVNSMLQEVGWWTLDMGHGTRRVPGFDLLKQEQH